ncbi:C-type lectin domain family 10 member A [Daphnia magna]|uniref:C-type lectin domain family 10 member A n=1 Tax=Daphnia magna TaxID=35525 RepID=UPI001E1BD700|nr:C-type lectin domain family 10 member A [Daphnia magna]
MHFRKCIVLLLVIFLARESDSLVRPRYFCPADFVRLGNGCYYFSSYIASWQNAHFACRDHGAQLAVLDSRWEDNTIQTYLSRPEFARLERWIGGLYDWSGQRWLWGATGQPMSFLGFGELSEGRLREWHCVYMDPEQGHRWNHKLCTRNLHYICELPLTKASPAQILQ